MQKLEIFQIALGDGATASGWRGTHARRCVQMVADAGYHGMAIDLGSTSLEDAQKCVRTSSAMISGCMINAFPTTIEGLRPVLNMAKDFDAVFVNIIGQVMPLAVADMIPVIRQWIEMAEGEGVPIQFETHRNCITNDLFATLLLIDAIPDMELCADLSHYLVDREFWYPISDEDNAMMHRILDRATSFQGRVASRGTGSGSDYVPSTSEVVRSVCCVVDVRVPAMARPS